MTAVPNSSEKVAAGVARFVEGPSRVTERLGEDTESAAGTGMAAKEAEEANSASAMETNRSVWCHIRYNRA